MNSKKVHGFEKYEIQICSSWINTEARINRKNEEKRKPDGSF
jgi:hypothetical protein